MPQNIEHILRKVLSGMQSAGRPLTEEELATLSGINEVNEFRSFLSIAISSQSVESLYPGLRFQLSSRGRQSLESWSHEADAAAANFMKLAREVERKQAAARRALTGGRDMLVYDRICREYPRLHWEQQQVLVYFAQSGNDTARQLVVLHNVALARSHARCKMPTESPDRIQAAIMGILEAMDKYDSSKGTRFSTWAILYIRKAVRECWECVGHCNVPSKVHFQIKNIDDWAEKLKQELGREPNTEELANATGLSTKRVRDIIEAAKLRHPLLLDDLVDSEEKTLHEPPGPEPPMESEESQVDLASAIQKQRKRLSRIEDQILDLWLAPLGGKKRSLRAIGALLHMSHVRVWQILQRAFRKMRDLPPEILDELKRNAIVPANYRARRLMLRIKRIDTAKEPMKAVRYVVYLILKVLGDSGRSIAREKLETLMIDKINQDPRVRPFRRAGRVVPQATPEELWQRSLRYAIENNLLRTVFGGERLVLCERGEVWLSVFEGTLA